MIFKTETYGGTVEILAADNHNAIPITLAVPSGAGASTVVKAGTPLALNEDGLGVATTGTGAVGILHYDVDTEENPVGALIVQGVIDGTKAQSHSGVTYSDGLMTALNAKGCSIVMRDNIGVNA